MSDFSSSKPDLEQLLRLGANIARAGNTGAAQALFRALSREYPGEVRAWLGLAGVSTSQAEQRDALEQILAIDPHHQQARRAIERLVDPVVRESPVVVTRVLPETLGAAVEQPAPVRAEPETPGEPEQTIRSRFPLLNAIALGIIVLLGIAVLAVVVRPLFTANQTAPSATPVLGQIAAPTSVGAVNAPGPATAGVPTLQPTLGERPASTAALPTLPPVSTPSAPPASTAVLPTALAGATEISLPLGTIVDVDSWSATLLRPDYALILDGAVGDLQPSGRFVLALLAVSNNAAVPRRIPTELFVLTDSQGRNYLPVANASTAYLALYGRGQRGDLALEDTIDPASGMRSVPILFDVPTDASNLALRVTGAGPAGWSVGGPAPTINTGP